jgi:phage shock protein PspC (stress-responsive transcriptional regulator)
MDLADQLQKLQTLREQGALTDEEFTLAKKRLLDPAEPAPAAASSATGASAANRAQSAMHQLRRSIHDRWIGGVCGGLAQTTNIPSWAWRILFVLTALLHGLGLVMYILLWIFVPLDLPASRAAPTTHENA